MTTHSYMTYTEVGVMGRGTLTFNEFLRKLNRYGDYAGSWLSPCNERGHVRTADKKCVMTNCGVAELR